MPRQRKLLPTYFIHAKSGRGRAAWTDHLGQRHERLLPGNFNSRESLEAFTRLQLELTTNTASCAHEGITVVELLASYIDFAERYYGENSKELARIASAVQPLRELYGELPAAEFGPKRLAAVRELMIRRDWCRSLINVRVNLIKRAFKWATAEELVPVTVYQSLRTLAGLRAGRSVARESEPVRPVADDTVAKTLPQLGSHVRCLVELLWHTGARPSEICSMTLSQLDRTGDVWIYRPKAHKTQHHGKERIIPLGPKARAVLEAHLEGRHLEPDAPIFSPRVAREERFAAMRSARKSKVQPSQFNRSKTKPRRLPAVWYTPNAVQQAIEAAAKRAGVPHWFPYQLRHAHGTKVRKEFGIEHAGAALGHTKMSATEVYAERDMSMAVEVAKRVG